MSRRAKKIVCPKCGSDDVAEYVYGMPTPEAWKLEQEGKVIIGGCCPEEDAPEYRCNKCKKKFGKFHW